MTIRLYSLICLLGALGLLASGCSSDPVCGNGKVEALEECDDGNTDETDGCNVFCELVPVFTTRVIPHWTIGGESIFGGGTFETCEDVGAAFVSTTLSGPGGFFDEQENSCGAYQATFTHSDTLPIPPGLYTVTIDMLDATRLSVAPTATGDLAVNEGVDNELTLDFPIEDFFAFPSFRGDLGFRAFWEMDQGACDQTIPPLDTRIITLSDAVGPLAGFPEVDVCHTSSQFIPGLIPGPYTLRIEGHDSMDATADYCEEYDVRVGVNVSQVYILVVPPTALSLNCQ